MTRDSDAATARGSARHPALILIVAGFSSLCAALMQSLVIPIQPQLPEMLGTSASNAAWVVTATLLAGGVAMPLTGKLADLKGRKPVLVASALLLLLGSLICALGDSLAPVLLGRVLQGLAMGYIPVAISFVREVMPPHLRNTAVAGISATLGVGGALGLPIAAWVAQSYDWHALFWLATVLAVIMVVATLAVLPHRPATGSGKLDVIGAIGMSVGIVALLVGISKGSDWGWASPATLGTILGGLVVLLLWGRFEIGHENPLVDLRTTARRPVLLTNIAAPLAGFGMMAQSIVVPQLLQAPGATGYGLGQTVLQAGLWMAPAGLMMMVFTPISSRMLTRLGGRTTLATGMVVMACGYLVAFFLTDAPWQLMLAACVSSAGVGIAYAAMPTLIMENSPASEAGAGVGVNALMRSMGTTVAGAVMAIVLTSITTTMGDTSLPTVAAFKVCFALGAVAGLGAAAVTLCIRRRSAEESPGEAAVELEAAEEPALP
ncbi:MFS transporter [Brachybacterium sacelli]|uniref:EmrB/QacA subfamily drug resistance transporter n=1 Tax=Brachybacterium sacelli TaxID=173364 RepID=A0ABS4WVX9_9MICO|nr:MFS transporter [Brachybacterium sacelli]MBP2380357.1 EmrB/QacA subfamily drug resistance transporter [Brachybacterium sacelli]